MKDRGTLTFLAELEVSASPLKPKVSRQSASRKSIHSHPQSCESTGQASPITETSQNGESGQTLLAMSLPEASRASRFPTPGSDEARRMTVSSGRQCSTLLDDSSPLSSLVKTCLLSSEWSSTDVCLIWKASAFGRSRLLFQLVPQIDQLSANGFSFWPNPNASDCECGGSAKMATRWLNGETRKSGYPIQGHVQDVVSLFGHKRRSPLWGWLMGFPPMHAELSATEIPSSLRSHKSSQKQSTDN